MKKILLLSILISFPINAAPPVTHQFTNGTTIEASQVNANYQELADRIEAADVSTNLQSLSTDVGILQGQVLQLQSQLDQLNTQNKKQLIGATIGTIPYSQILNRFEVVSLCQSEFTESTVCSIEDINNTVNIPALSMLPVDRGALIIDIDNVSSNYGLRCLASNGYINTNVFADLSSLGTSSLGCVENINIACCR